MDDSQFWTIIEQARDAADNDPYEVCNALEEALAAMQPGDILEFDRLFYQHFFESYRADLWGAAFLMNGGCSDDGFDYFRGWLIVQGREVFENALKNPDSLADVVSPDDEADFGFEDEDVLNVAYRAWMRATNKTTDEFYEQRADVGGNPALAEFLWSDGQGDMDEKAGKRLYPKLWKQFGE
jgi:hypothetical protein